MSPRTPDLLSQKLRIDRRSPTPAQGSFQLDPPATPGAAPGFTRPTPTPPGAPPVSPATPRPGSHFTLPATPPAPPRPAAPGIPSAPPAPPPRTPTPLERILAAAPPAAPTFGAQPRPPTGGGTWPFGIASQPGAAPPPKPAPSTAGASPLGRTPAPFERPPGLSRPPAPLPPARTPTPPFGLEPRRSREVELGLPPPGEVLPQRSPLPPPLPAARLPAAPLPPPPPQAAPPTGPGSRERTDPQYRRLAGEAPEPAAPPSRPSAAARLPSAPKPLEPSAPQTVAARAVVAEPPVRATAPVRSAALVEVRARPAPLWRRVGALLLDAGIVLGVLSLYLWLATLLVHPAALRGPQLPGLDGLMTRLHALHGILVPVAVLGLLLAVVYSSVFAFLWGGRSPGRWLFGIRLVDRTGFAPMPGRAVVRSLLAVVSFAFCLAGFWLSLFDRRGQTLHDKLTRTFVVRPG